MGIRNPFLFIPESPVLGSQPANKIYIRRFINDYVSSSHYLTNFVFTHLGPPLMRKGFSNSLILTLSTNWRQNRKFQERLGCYRKMPPHMFVGFKTHKLCHNNNQNTLSPLPSNRFCYRPDSGGSRDQLQPGSFFQRLKEAEERESGNFYYLWKIANDQRVLETNNSPW